MLSLDSIIYNPSDVKLFESTSFTVITLGFGDLSSMNTVIGFSQNEIWFQNEQYTVKSLGW